uniref:Uncharacterized protein n=1 Tax=Meloidogyne enterolobii TaxID=390850 RepID=A0A6V7VAB4_MELEN|nr:unnamed protein product [Meloidogyne enterolobii]
MFKINIWLFLFSIIFCSKLNAQEEWRNQWQPNKVTLNEQRKHIDVDTRWLDREYKEKTGQTVQKVGLDASNKEKAIVDLITEQKQLSASAHGNVAIAESSVPGQRAQVQKFGDKGGLAQVEGHRQNKFKKLIRT